MAESVGGEMATIGTPFLMIAEREGEDASGDLVARLDLLLLPLGEVCASMRCVSTGAMFYDGPCGEEAAKVDSDVSTMLRRDVEGGCGPKLRLVAAETGASEKRGKEPRSAVCMIESNKP